MTNYPTLLEVQLTGECNLKCSYCGNSEEYLTDSCASCDTVLRAVEELKPKSILFTGGEVYLEWELLLEILCILKKKNSYNYILSSNLTLINQKKLDCLIDNFGFSVFHSSFNDLTPEMTYSIRKGSPIERENLISNLRHLCERGMTVKVETMLIRDTVEKLYEINEFLYQLGVKYHKLEFLIPLGQAQRSKAIDYYYALDKILDLWKRKKNDSILVPCCCPVTPCMNDHPIFDVQSDDLIFNKCIDGTESCYLLSNGTLLPCFLFPDNQIGSQCTSYYEQWLYDKNFVGMRLPPSECTKCDYSYIDDDSKNVCSSGCKVYNYVLEQKYGRIPVIE